MRLLPSQEGVLFVGEWELVLELGPGLYLARKSGPRRFARLGALRSLGGGATAHDTLLADISRASAASHPLICTVQDAGESGGERFVVTQYVEGGSLRELMARGAVPPIDVAVAIAIDALAALFAVHEARDAKGRPLVHGAITAAAVVVGADGRTRLSDLGLRRLAKGDDDPLGVRSYAAPEVLRGIAPDATSDVYAMGRVLYELLAGAAPPREEGALPLLSSVSPNVPAAIAEAVARATAPDRDHRFRSADAFAAALEKAVTPASPRSVSRWVEDNHAYALAERRAAAGAWSEARAEALGYKPPSRFRVFRVRVARRLRKHRWLSRGLGALALATLGASLGLIVWWASSRPRATSAAQEQDPPRARAAPDLPSALPAAPEGTAETATEIEIEIESLPSSTPPDRPRQRRRTKPAEEQLSNPYR